MELFFPFLSALPLVESMRTVLIIPMDPTRVVGGPAVSVEFGGGAVVFFGSI